MKIHPAANIFPLMEGEDFDELVEDIRKHGQLEPIYLYQGRVLDGRNRLRACHLTKTDPWTEKLDPREHPDPIATVISLNLRRRHLTTAQRSMAASKADALWAAEEEAAAARKARGKKPSDLEEHLPQGRAPQSRDRVGRAFNVSGKSVETAKKIRETAAPDVVKAVERGDISLNRARQLSELPKAQQVREVRVPKTKKQTHSTVDLVIRWLGSLPEAAGKRRAQLNRFDLSASQRKAIHRGVKAVQSAFDQWETE